MVRLTQGTILFGDAETQLYYNRLKCYEDTGLTPEDVEILKIKSTPMRIEEVHVDEYICPACGSENNCEQGIIDDKYCPNCGQALSK